MLTDTATPATILKRQAWAYDDAGNRLTWTDSNALPTPFNPIPADTVWTYTFDANNRVAFATATIDGVEHRQSWAYDARGNVKSQLIYKKVNNAWTLDSGTTTTYTATNDAATNTVALLGDNTVVSVDSRHWTSGVLPGLVRGVVYQPFWARR